MTDSQISDLQQLAKDVSSHTSTMPEKMAALSKAFELFSRETSRLEAAYSSLQQQFETVNKQLQEANQQLQEKVLELDTVSDYLENILNNMSQGLLFVNAQGIVTTYNPAAEYLLGTDRQAVLFHPFSEVFGDTFFGFSMQAALNDGKGSQINLISLPLNDKRKIKRELEIESTFVIKSFRKTPAEASLLDVAMGMIILFRDITEIRDLQLIANRNDRMKDLGEMAAMMAHEIRNPLGGIKGFASLLVRDLQDQPKLQEMAHYIVEGTDNLSRLVTNILNYSRPLQLERQPTLINHLMTELIEHIKVDSLMRKDISILSHLPEEKIEIEMDPQLIKSAILNLVVNSIQAMPKGGTLTLSVWKDATYLYLKVQDTGQGIPENAKDKIFRPFFTTKAEGYGFGLSEVFRIVQSHQGTIKVESEEGKGSAFTIKIPFYLSSKDEHLHKKT